MMEPLWYKSWPDGVPKKFDPPEKTLPEIIEEIANIYPRRDAINFYGYRMYYGSLVKMIKSFSYFLIKLGVKKGDRVCLFMENCPQYIISILSVWRIGAVAVPANPMFKEDELFYQLNDSGAETIILLDILYPVLHRIREKTCLKNVIVTGYWDFLPAIPSLPLHPSLKVPRQYFPDTLEMSEFLNCKPLPGTEEMPRPEDLALLQYTSGTTGIPKGAMITHANILFNTICSTLWLEDKDSINLAVMPLFNVMGLIHSMNKPLYTGGTIILLARYDTATVIKAIEKYRVTYWAGVATMYVAVLNYPDVKKYNLKSLRACVCGGSPIPLPILKDFKEMTGANVVEGYGLSETISQVIANPVDKPRLGSVGIPVINTFVKIVDLADPSKEVQPGNIGELMVKGPQVTNGYWRQPAETAINIIDGWLATGDIVKMDEDGYIYFVGRKKEMIKASGFSVFPAEVENFLSEHPAIAEVAVLGIPDSYRGESVKAFVVLKSEYENKVSETDIINWAREKMAAYKYPRVVEFCTELPRNGSGKIMRHILAEK
ncbi:AMP-binding protein [Desulfotruncus alcoholivorax]|uniref:AMP-binding protein n=1 Tax=Desulfotruncus alcoholivorax TaxID=265477 RepID=UPI0003F8EB52|nr:AMP-binding protein [Desulfotruncus alcoholivorax]